MRIIAYTGDAEVLCITDTYLRYGEVAVKNDLARDQEGSALHPIFSSDKQLEPLHCGVCHKGIT